MPNMIDKKYLQVAVLAAKQNGSLFKKYFGCAQDVQMKNNDPRDLVTEIDKKIETHIRKLILKNFPSHKIIGEEFGAQELKKNDLVWIIDPIDGTHNYIQGLPLCCISIALWDSKGPLAAVVYNPILNQIFTAARSKGAFLNGKKIKVSGHNKFSQAFGGYGWGRNIDKAAKKFPQLLRHLHKMRTFGSSTMELAYVGAGNYDFHIQADINVWDFAASVLIIKEAGGKVTDWSGKAVEIETKNLIASNGKLHKNLLLAIKDN